MVKKLEFCNNGTRKKGIILSYENDVLTLETLKKKKGSKKSYITKELKDSTDRDQRNKT